MKKTEFKKYLPIIKTSLLSSIITLILCAICFPINANVEDTKNVSTAYTASYIEEVHDALAASNVRVTEEDIATGNTETLIDITPVIFTARDFEELYKVTSSNELVDSEDEEFTATETPAIIEFESTVLEDLVKEGDIVDIPEEVIPTIEEEPKEEPPVEVETPTEEVVEIPSAEDVQEEDSKPNMTYLGYYRITGYDTCAACNGNSSGLTAMGTYITPGRTVAMSKSFPLGTKIYIEGLGYRTVEDRGNFPSTTIDVAVDSHDDAYAITGHYEVYLVE